MVFRKGRLSECSFSVKFSGLILQTRPFIIDLESTNGTIVNEEIVPAARYYELKPGDGEPLISDPVTPRPTSRAVIKFGLSTREYVLLHDEVS